MTITSSILESPCVAAVVVGFFPELEILHALLLNVSTQVDYLYLIDNGGCDGLDLSALPFCKHIKLGQNFGLGYALNAGFSAAKADSAHYVATFDQDSAPPDNLIATLLLQHQNLDAQGIKCGAIGPTFFDRRETNTVFFPFYKEKESGITATTPSPSSPDMLEVDVLITSGMLIKMSTWEDQLHYDENMFVDYTDTDWCFRARNKAYRLFGSTTVKMGHALSDAPPIRLFNLTFFHYSPLRRYYYFRNTIILCKAPYVSFLWKKRLLMGLLPRLFVIIFYEKKLLTQLKMISQGIWSGITSKTGRYQA